MATPATIPAPLDPLQDFEALNKRLDTNWDVGVYRRPWREAVWFRNIKFIEGSQWLQISKNATIRDRPLPAPLEFPRAITNKMVKIHDDLVNAVSQGKFPFINRPATDDAEDFATAEVQDRFDDLIFEEAEITHLRKFADAWLCSTGNVFLLPYYDYDKKWGTRPVNKLRCPQCEAEYNEGDEQVMAADGQCPQCVNNIPQDLGPEVATTLASALPPLESFTAELPIGRLRTEIYSPFEIIFDNGIPAHKERTWFFCRHKYPIEQLKEMFPDYADQIKEGMDDIKPTSQVDYMEALSYMGAVFGTGVTTAGAKAHLLTVLRYYEMPCAKYPDGAIVTRIGAKLIIDAKPMFDEDDEERLFPLVHIGDRIASGSAWYHSRLTDIVPLQIRRNIVESLAQLTFQRTGAAKLLVPFGSQVKNIVGDPGQMLEYSPIVHATGTPSEPHYLEAALGNIAWVERWLAQIDNNMEMIAGTFWLSGGDAPPGIEAASALAILDERAVRGIASLRTQEIEGWRQWKIRSTLLMRKHMTDDRLLMVLGRNKQWQATKFKQAQLKGSVDVLIDTEALFPKSEATKRATTQQLVAMKVVIPTDPETRWAIAQEFGKTALLGATDEAIQQAIREYDRFMSDESYIPQVLPMVQNSQAHWIQHRRDSMTQEFEQLVETNPIRAQVWIDHVANTGAAVMAEMVSTGGLLQGGAPDAQGGVAGSLPGSAGEATTGESAQQRKGREVVAGNRDEPPAEPIPPMDQAIQ